MCQSCHVRPVTTYRTAAQATGGTRPGQREGAAALTTQAPNAAVSLPTTLEEAVAALAATPTAVPVAGGTDLMAAVNAGLLRPAALVGLGRVAEIRGWQYLDGHALLGAGLTHARMGRPDFAALIPALAAAARAAGPPHIRNAGTLGGNIATAAPTGDALPVLAALEATVLLASVGGARREVPVSHLLTGMDPLRGGELISHVRVPLLHAPQVFLKATGRTGPGRAVASLALVLDPARRAVRCAVGAIAPMPLRPLEAEAWVSALVDWDGDRSLAPEALAAFRRVRRRRLRYPNNPRARTASCGRSRPPSRTCAAPSARWPVAHWGGRSH
ncbi:LOW QUALITY PROTEIN: oxidoreductase, partial [Streptomyces sp. SPB074]